MKHLQKRSFWIFFALGMYYGGTRLWPVLRFGDAAFGYDLGIYRRIVIDYLSGAPQPSFAFGHLARGLHHFGLSVDAMLYGLYIAVALLIGILFVWYIKKKIGTTAALIGACLFVTSTVQLSLYQWYYFRNLIALVLVLCSSFLLEKKSPFLFLCLFALCSIHPLTAIPVVTALVVYALLRREYRTHIFLHLAVGIGAACALNWAEFARYGDIALQSFGRVAALSSDLRAELDGQFIDLRKYLLTTVLYTPFGIIGFWKYRKKHLFWSLLFVVSAALIAARVLLYKRFFLVVDLSLLFFASVYMASLMQKMKHARWRNIVVLVYSAYLFWLSVPTSLYPIPGIAPSSLEHIKALSHTLPPHSTILSFDAATAPWLLGFAGDHTVIAPGVFDANKWNRAQWETFWSSQDVAQRQSLLAAYNVERLYIFSTTPGTDVLFSHDTNMQQLTHTLWQYMLNP